MASVVGKGWAKGESAIPVRGPSVAVVGTGKGQDIVGRGGEGGGRRSRMGDGVSQIDQAERVGSGRQERKTLRVISA